MSLTVVKDRFYRFIEKIPEHGCWIWMGHLKPNGYGMFDKKNAHRVSYEFEIGQIPKGLDLDHLCRVRGCVNPNHLEPVTRSENLRRGETGSFAKKQAEHRTHCTHGHPYDDKNTRWYSTKYGLARSCKECQRQIRKRRKDKC